MFLYIIEILTHSSLLRTTWGYDVTKFRGAALNAGAKIKYRFVYNLCDFCMPKSSLYLANDVTS